MSLRPSGCRYAAVLACALALRAAEAPPADFEGTWLGTVTAPNASTEIGFAFRPTAKGLLTTFYMPAMAVYGTPVGPARLDADTLTFPPLATTLKRDGSRLVGTFGLSHLPIELKAGGTFAPAPPAPTYPAGPAPVWTTPLRAEVWGSPATDGRVVYLGTAAGAFHALDAVTGRIRWTWTGRNPLYGSALLTHDLVCFVDARRELIALRPGDGSLAWRTPLRDADPAGAAPPANETYTHRTAVPVLLGDMLYVGSSDGGIYAIEPATGSVRWRHEAKSRFYAPAGRHGDHLLFGGYDGAVIVFDPRARTELARTRLPGPVVSAPVAVGDIVLVGCRDYMLYGLRRSDLSVAWKHSYWFSWVESTPAIADGIVYVGGSDFARVTALEPATGRARWSTAVHGLTWGTPLVANDTVYAGTSAQSGALIPHEGGFLALDRERGTVKWRQRIDFPTGATHAGFLGSPVLADEKIVAVTFDGQVIAYPSGR